MPGALDALGALCIRRDPVSEELQAQLLQAGLAQLLPALLRQTSSTGDPHMALAFALMMCEWITEQAAGL